MHLPSATIQRYYNIIDGIPYAVHFIPVTSFLMGSLFLLILHPLSLIGEVLFHQSSMHSYMVSSSLLRLRNT